jgi:hypothetical protein
MLSTPHATGAGLPDRSRTTVKYNQKLLERFAMQTLTMTEPIPPTQSLKIDEVGAALGLSIEQSRQFATDMQEEGWAKLNFSSAPTLQLTLAGKKAIGKFHMPRWRRWINENPGIWASIIGPASSLVFMSILELLKWWLR